MVGLSLYYFAFYTASLYTTHIRIWLSVHSNGVNKCPLVFYQWTTLVRPNYSRFSLDTPTMRLVEIRFFFLILATELGKTKDRFCFYFTKNEWKVEQWEEKYERCLLNVFRNRKKNQQARTKKNVEQKSEVSEQTFCEFAFFLLSSGRLFLVSMLLGPLFVFIGKHFVNSVTWVAWLVDFYMEVMNVWLVWMVKLKIECLATLKWWIALPFGGMITS